MATINLTLDTRRMKADGTYPLCYYISFSATLRIRLKANLCLTPANWNGEAIIPRKENTRLNLLLEEQTHRLRQIVLNLELSGRARKFGNAQLKSEIEHLLYSHASAQATTLDAYMCEVAAEKKRENTRYVYEQTRRKIEMFAGKQLLLGDIDITWLRRFEAFLANSGTSINGINLHMRNLRAVFNQAIDAGIADANLYPFRRFQLKTESTPKRSLGIEHIRSLRDYRAHNKSFQEAADTFLLILYLRGINYIDLCNLTTINADGTCTYRRAKTGRLYTIRIEPEAQAIIDKYPGKKFLVDFNERCKDYKNHLANINKRLKAIGRELNMPDSCKISTYWARHSWATIAANYNIPKDTIAASLGHGMNTVTDIYIDFSQEKVDKANRVVIDAVCGSGSPLP